MTKRLLIALAALLVLAGFVSACGGDDDDDAAPSDDDSAETLSATEQFCTDFDNANGGDTPIAEVQDSLDRAVAAQEEASSEEVSDAFQTAIDFTRAVIDGDDGDGVITDAEAEAQVESFPTLEDAMTVLSDSCVAPSRGGDPRTSG